MATLNQLADRLDAYAAGMDKRASDRTKQCAEAILADLVRSTPADTSQAISNWQIGVGSKPSDKVAPYFKGEKGSTALQSGTAALAAGREVLRTKRPGQTMFISNVLPYIHRLNEGSSKQAPAGFVERAILIGRRFMGRGRGGR